MSEPTKHVLVVGGSRNYYQPFAAFGDYTDDMDILRNRTEIVTEEVSLVLFTGGEDVDPILYGEPQHRLTSFNTRRDMFEVLAFHAARRHNLPLVGVCRGAQFLCVMAGGKLVQHVENHSGNHTCQLWDGREIVVSSTHHQMQRPPVEAEIVGWCDPARSKTHQSGFGKELKLERESEIVYYPTINAVGMQHHPEMMSPNAAGFKIAEEVLRHFIPQLNT